MAVTNRYFRRGCLGGLALAKVHDAVFADGPRFGVPLPAGALGKRLITRPRALLAALRDTVEFRAGARRLQLGLGTPQRVAATPE